MNPNSGWADYFANRCKSRLSKYYYYDGLFIDDVPLNLKEAGYTFSVSYSYFDGNVLKYWESGMIKMLAKVKSAVGSKIVMPNAWKYTSICKQATKATFWEGFIHSRSASYNNLGYGWTTGWEGGLLAVNLLHRQAELGNIIGVNSGCKYADSHPTATKQWQRFTLACFLFAVVDMSKAFYTWQFVNTDFSKGYFPEMDYNFGYPLSDYKLLKSKTYIREFSNYKVIANLDMSYSCSFTVNGVRYKLAPRSALFIKK